MGGPHLGRCSSSGSLTSRRHGCETIHEVRAGARIQIAHLKNILFAIDEPTSIACPIGEIANIPPIRIAVNFGMCAYALAVSPQRQDTCRTRQQQKPPHSYSSVSANQLQPSLT